MNWFILMAFFLGGGDPWESTSRKWALLVGINNYQHWPDLAGCANDVALIKEMLVDRFEFPPDQIATLIDEQATRHEMIRRFEKHLIANAKSNDVVLFYFAGHGAQVKDTSGDESEQDGLDETLVPCDSEGPAGDITDDEINQLLASVKARHTVFILDSCHSGSGIKAESSRGISRALTLPHSGGKINRSDDGDFRPSEANYTFIAATASNENAKEVERDGRIYGALSHALVSTLTAHADIVTYRDWLDHVTAVLKRNRQIQHPQFAGDLLDNFLFSNVKAPANNYLIADPLTGSQVTLRGAVGVSVGDHVVIYPPSTKSFKESEAIAHAEVEKVAPTTIARLTDMIPIPDASRAVRIKAHQVRQLSVYAPGFPTLPDQAMAPGSGSQLVFVDTAESAHLQIKPTSKDHIEFFWPDGTLVAQLDASGPEDWLLLNQALHHWTRWYQILSIEPLSAPLPVEVRVKTAKGQLVLPIPAKSRENHRFHYLSELPRYPHPLREQETLVVEITNTDKKVLYFSAYNLSSNGAITRVIPEIENDQPLNPNQRYTFQLSAAPAQCLQRSGDVLKLFFTQDRENLKWLEMQPLFQCRTVTDKGATRSKQKLPSDSRWDTRQVYFELIQ